MLSSLDPEHCLFLQLWRNLPIQAPTCNTRHNSCFSISSSKAVSLPTSPPHVRWILLYWYMPPVDFFFPDLSHSISHKLFAFAIATVQCSATVLSSEPQTLLMGKPCWTCFTFCTRFAAICRTTSSNQGIISPFFVSRNYAITRPCTFVPDGCSTTA